MNHTECKDEVHLPFEVIETHTIPGTLPCIDPIEQSGPLGAASEFQEHPGLHIYGNDSPLGTDEACQCQREVAHPGARFKNDHSRSYEWTEDGSGIMHQTPERACQKITKPPGAHIMRHFSPRVEALTNDP